MLKIILRKIYRILSEIKYNVDLSQHASKLPALSSYERTIVEACRQEGAFITALDALDLPSTREMLEEAKKAAG